MLTKFPTFFPASATALFAAGLIAVVALAALSGRSAATAPSILPTWEGDILTPENVERINRVSRFFNDFESLSGRFVQVGPRGNVSDGVFYISKPGKMRFEYNPPSPYLIVSDGVWVMIMNRRNRRIDHYPLATTPLRLVLSKHVDLLNQARILDVGSENGAVTLTLAAKSGIVPGRLTLTYSEEKSEIERWTVIDGEGRRTTVSLSEISFGDVHDAALFRVERRRQWKNRDDNR